MRNLWGRNDRSNIWVAMAWGVGGVVVGAVGALLLTPTTGAELRRLARGFVTKNKGRDELGQQHDAMENEGGVSHAVSPPSATSSSAAH